jgi:hypothetical protein
MSDLSVPGFKVLSPFTSSSTTDADHFLFSSSRRSRSRRRYAPLGPSNRPRSASLPSPPLSGPSQTRTSRTSSKRCVSSRAESVLSPLTNLIAPGPCSLLTTRRPMASSNFRSRTPPAPSNFGPSTSRRMRTSTRARRSRRATLRSLSLVRPSSAHPLPLGPR